MNRLTKVCHEKGLFFVLTSSWFALENISKAASVLFHIFVAWRVARKRNLHFVTIVQCLAEKSLLIVMGIQVHHGNAICTLGRKPFRQSARCKIRIVFAHKVSTFVDVICCDPCKRFIFILGTSCAITSLPLLGHDKANGIVVLGDKFDCILWRGRPALVHLNCVNTLGQRLVHAIVDWRANRRSRLLKSRTATLSAFTWNFELPEATFQWIEIRARDMI